MTSYSGSSRNHFTALFYFLFFSAYLLLLPMPTMAQKRPTRFMDRPERRVILVRPSFTYNPSSPTAGQEVQFTDTSKGSLASWQWDFGDGTTSADQHPSHTFSAPGSYRVKLTAGDRSASKDVTRAINVLSSASITSLSVGAVSFMYAPASLVAGSRVQFTDTSTNSPTSWLWDFGDGGVSSIQNPSYTYRVAGSYAVTLTTRSGSDSGSVSRTVTIFANIITAASPSFADVTSAISSAKSGDTVIVPAGSATWTNQLLITKGIFLLGAGIGNTVITSDYGGSDNYWLIRYAPTNPASDVPFRLSGFEFNGNSRSNLLQMVNNTINPLTKTRIDHNKFYGAPGDSNIIVRGGPVYGVADNNVIIYNPAGSNQVISNLGLQDRLWNNTTFTPGTADNFYWEDNNFTTTCAIAACGQGGRYCFRHNTITYIGPTGTWQIFDMHGNQTYGQGGTNYATMGGEIYENTIVTNSNEQLLDQRGGIALVYNNTIISPSGSGWIKIREEENDNLCPTTGRTDGYNPISGQPQHVSESYYWNNLHNSVSVDPYVAQSVDYGPPIGIVPQENVDFWKQVTPFTGASGVGVGLLSSRPTTCTTGVAYWATDTKTLYKATAPNTWTVYYTPYTYPHPLRNE